MKFLLMIALAVTVSCSKSPNSQNSIKDINVADSNEIDFGEVKVAVPLSGIIPSSSLDFASLEYKQSGTQDIQITYSPSSGSLTLGALDFDTSLIAPFSIKTNGCITTLLPRKSCVIKLQLSNSQSLPDDQNLTSLIKIKGSDISLTGILKKDLTDYSLPAVSFSVSPLSLNFGSFKNGESKELSIAVKNNSSAGSAVSISSISNSNVSISYNSCPVSPALLGARVSCVVRLKYLGAAAEVKSNENLIKIANYQVTYSAIVTSPSVSEPETLAIEPQVSATTVAMNQPDNQSRTISFTNTGTLPLVAPVSAVSSDNGIQIVSVSCAGGLARSKICDISYNIISAQLPSGASTQTIKLQSGTLASNIFSLNLDIVPNEVPCTLANAQANGVDINNSTSAIQGMKVGENISQCTLASNACNQYYLISGDSKSCNAQTLACSAQDAQENGWTTTSAATYSGNRVGSDVSNCNVLSCALNYEITGKDCTAIACTQLNSGIANVLTVTGTKASGCLVSTCINEYEQVGNLCNAVLCTTANAQGNGITSILNVATVSGDIFDNSCLVASCDSYYKNAVDNRSCLPKLCTELNAGELSSLGYNLTGATISGTYNSCTVSCNSSFQQLAADSKSCVDRDIVGSNFAVNSISSGTVYTNASSVNIDSSTIQNASQMAFSFTSCAAATSFEAFNPTKTLTITAPLNTSKNLYAKYKNGTKESCINRIIVHDSFAPSAPENLVATGEAKNKSTPVFSWDQSYDSNSITYEIAFGTTVGGAEIQPYSSTAALAAYASIVLSSLEDGGTYYTKVRAKDAAGNYSSEISTSWSHMIGNTRLEKVASGNLFSCALKNGSLYCWGTNYSYEISQSSAIYGSSTPMKVNLASTVLDFDIGGSTVCAIMAPNRSLKCWGKNDFGQAGLGGAFATPAAGDVATMTSNVSQVSVGESHVCAIKDGIAYCWGENQYGRLGIGTVPAGTSSEWTPKPVCLVLGASCAVANYFKNVTQISAGGSHTCAIANEGQGYCWGLDTTGQLGDDATLANKGIPTAIATIGGSATNFFQISAGGTHTCAIRFNQNTTDSYNALYCWGNQVGGALGNSVITGQIATAASSANPFTSNVSQVYAGSQRTCVVKDGELYCWGANSRGEIGDSAQTTTNVLIPSRVKYSDSSYFKNTTSLGLVKFGNATNSSVMCALDSGKVSCWGYNGAGISPGYDYSSVGNENFIPDTFDSATKTVRVPYTIPSLVGLTISKVATDGGNVCILVNGGLKCIGANTSMQLGNVNFTASSYNTPVTPTGMDTGVTDIYIYGSTMCAIKNMQLYCWGNGLGAGVPTLVSTMNRDVLAYTFGSMYNKLYCASQGGLAKCWGVLGGTACSETNLNPIGTGDCVTNSATPKKVCGAGSTGASPTCAGLYNVTKINTDGASVCAISQNRHVCWGENHLSTATSVHNRAQYSTNLSSGMTDAIVAGYDIGATYAHQNTAFGGYNSEGYFGTTQTAWRLTFPVSAATTFPADLINYKNLSYGSSPYYGEGGAVCGIQNGIVKCWGGDSISSANITTYFGYFATPTVVTGKTLPTQISTLINSKSVSVGSGSVCAENNGAIYCWGYKNNALLFNNVNLTNSQLPVIMNFGF